MYKLLICRDENGKKKKKRMRERKNESEIYIPSKKAIRESQPSKACSKIRLNF